MELSLHRLTDERPSENMTPRSFDLLLISRVRKKLETQRRSNNRSKAERSQLGAGRHIDQRRHYGRPSNVFHRAGSGASKYYDDAYTLKNECDTITIETVETANPMAATVIGSVAHRPWGLGGGGVQWLPFHSKLQWRRHPQPHTKKENVADSVRKRRTGQVRP